MSQQTTLTSFFKSRAVPVQNMSDKNNKRRSLSLKKPSTSSALSQETSEDVILVKKEVDVVLVSSDSDHEHEPTPAKRQNVKVSNDSEDVFTSQSQTTPLHSSSSSLDASCSSANTFVYNLSPGSVWQSPETPSKVTRSPGSSGKYFSPTKKRLLKKKSPVKRNLINQFKENNLLESPLKDKDFTPSYGNTDDKTNFLLLLIDKYLKTDSLKPLLEDQSQVLLEKCMHLVDPGLRLVCRLYWRQNDWYRMEELGSVRVSGEKEFLNSPGFKSMIKCLVENGLITAMHSEGATQMVFDDYVKLLKKPELQQICKDLKLKIQSKQDAVEALRIFSKLAPISNFFKSSTCTNNNHTRVLEIFKSKAGQCYKLSDLARTTLYNLYVLMYLGIDYSIIRDKKLEYVLIYDKIKRETYPIDKSVVVDDASVVFQDQREFYRYLQAHMISEKFYEKTDINEKCEIVKQSYNLYKGIAEDDMIRYKSLPVWLRRFTPPNIFIKVLENGVQELKKLKTEHNYKLAVEILDMLIAQIAFRQHKKAIWYAEKALILHSHLDSSEKAAKVLLEGFNSDLSDDCKDAMRPRAKKIANQQNIDLKEELREELRSHATKDALLESNLPGEHIYKQPKDNHNQRGKLKFEAYTDQGRTTVSAEDYCVLHYIHNGSYMRGEHWEGRIVTTIFFLLFWDIIYTKPRGVAGIFLNHLQRYPLDMFSESFYINRKILIDERLIFIQNCTEDTLINMMQTMWLKRPESEISDIQRSIGWDTVREVTSCLRAAGVAAVCRRLAHNYGYACSGFPDLTLWDVNTKKIKFVEVKTDSDKPSVKQLQWLQYLRQHGIEAGFCYVGTNTTRCRARPAATAPGDYEYTEHLP